MAKFWLPFILLLLLCKSTFAQYPNSYAIGSSAQIYPSGLIVNGHFGFNISRQDMIYLFGGYNFVDRQDYGEHDKESGTGYGFGLSWRHYRYPYKSGLSLGGRLQVWIMSLDWENSEPQSTGVTDLVVLQPTLQLAYSYLFAGEYFSLDALIAAGGDINLQTKGDKIGQNIILLIGVAISFQF